jgi:hypothetical protein
MTENSAVSWTTIVARGASKKVLVTPARRNVDSSSIPLVGEVIFEDDDLKSEILVRKATAIVQQALSSGSVLFSFPGRLFGDRVDAYKVIQEQVGANVQFRPISTWRENAGGDLLVEATFKAKVDATKAVSDGVTVNGVVYKAVSTCSGSGVSVGGNLTHVQFTMLNAIPDEHTFLVDMLDSLAFYGKVYQLKKYSRKGYFEGKMSVLLDTSVGMKGEDGEVLPSQPLSRMLYLNAWDSFAPAQFKNAPPVCHFCRLSGHVRKDCPELAKRVCFSCREHGHTARFCKVKSKSKQDKDKSFAVELSEYVALSGGKKLGPSSDSEDIEVQEEATADDEEDQASVVSMVSVGSSASGSGGVSGGVSGAAGVVGGDVTGVVNNDNAVDTMEVDGEGAPSSSGQKAEYNPNSPYGVNASKFADFEVASTMKVDSAQEMLDLSKVKARTQNKIDFLKKNIVNVAKTKASASAIKTSKSSKSSSSAHRA